MITTQKIQTGATVASLAALLLAAPVLAQGARAVRIAGPVAAKSETLRQAQALFQYPAHWAEAAQLMISAAKLRAPGDPERAQLLATGARLYAYTGNTHRALYWMQQAAQQALAGGDVLAAAQDYTQAAHLAVAERDWVKAQALAQKVMALAGSPLLSDEQRLAIRTPFQAQAVAVAAGK